MSFKVGIFTRGEKTHSYKYEKAFAEGLIEHGHDVIFYKWADRPETIDLAVMWSIKNEALITHLKNLDTDFVVLERGYIGDRKKWTSCGFNGLNGRADFCNDRSDGKRLKHVEKYMSTLRRVKGNGKYIIVMGQVPSDSSVKHLKIGFGKWVYSAYKALDPMGWWVYYRPHPLDKEPYIPKGMKVIEGDLDKVIRDAHFVATFNSNSGVDSILAGVPCAVSDEGSMVWDLRADIDNPKVPDRYQWLKDMSYTQWTIEEMSSGETWKHLLKRYEG